MDFKRLAFTTTLVLLGAVLALLWSLTGSAHGAQSDNLTVCPTGPPDCDYAFIQAAVDAASDGDVIKVAIGIYTGVQVRPRRDITTSGIVTQVVYISKTVTIRGGYTAPDFSEPPDFEGTETLLDAQSQGRVLYITGEISPTIEGLRIAGGDAAGLGGGWWQSGAGGGVYVITAAVTLSSTQVISNAADCGAGLYFYRCSNTTLIGNVIAANSIHRSSGTPPYAVGGGLFAGWCNDTVLGENTIVSNTAHVHGGGIYLISGNATLDKNSVRANSASSCGGGAIYSQGALVNGNTFEANKALQGSGGGLCLNADATLTNNMIVDNQVSDTGSGLIITGPPRCLVHNTIARNTGGDGSGVYVAQSGGPPFVVTMTNTILVSQTLGVHVTAGNTVTLEATLWGTGTWANDMDWGGSGTIISGTRNLWGDPDFVAAGLGDYHIGPASAAIDKGVDTGTGTDIDGDVRPDGCFSEIGADERISGGVCSRVYLPLIFDR